MTEAFPNRIYEWSNEVRPDANVNLALQQIITTLTQVALKEVGTKRKKESTGFQTEPWILNMKKEK